jgi:hypothetical protein
MSVKATVDNWTIRSSDVHIEEKFDGDRRQLRIESKGTRMILAIEQIW